MHHLATALNDLKAELNSAFLERDDAIESAILALVAGEHWFAVSPPGAAKSNLVDTLMGSIEGASTFKIGLSKTRPAEAVLGPLDIKRFRENGEYVLKRQGFITDVDLAFIDEIGKMSPVLGHDLLSVLNEREYHEVNGGRSVHTAPLHCAFTASNEMPANESDDAAALWDRLLVRVICDYIKEPGNFARLLADTLPKPTTTVKYADILDVKQNVLPNIVMSTLAVESLVKLRMDLGAEHIHPSDRRFRASVNILRASAFLDGRDIVDDSDLAALRFTLWDTPEQVDRVTELCFAAANPFVVGLQPIVLAMREIEAGLVDRSNSGEIEQIEYAKEIHPKLISARQQLDDLLTQAAGRPIPGFKAASDKHLDLSRRKLKVLGSDDQMVELMLSTLKGLGDGEN